MVKTKTGKVVMISEGVVKGNLNERPKTPRPPLAKPKLMAKPKTLPVA